MAKKQTFMQKHDDKIKAIAFLIMLNGFIYYYYYMKWVRKMTPQQVVDELIKYPQDFIYVIFFTVINIILLIWLIKW